MNPTPSTPHAPDTAIALDRPMFTLAPCGSGWRLNSPFLDGLAPDLTRLSNMTDAHSAMEIAEHVYRKALGLPDWRELSVRVEELAAHIAEYEMRESVKPAPRKIPGPNGCLGFSGCDGVPVPGNSRCQDCLDQVADRDAPDRFSEEAELMGEGS